MLSTTVLLDSSGSSELVITTLLELSTLLNVIGEFSSVVSMLTADETGVAEEAAAEEATEE